MFTISAGQMAILDAHSFDLFAARLTRFIRAQCGSPSARNPALVPDSDEQLSFLVRSHLDRARGYGMKNEQSLAAFVSLAFSYTPEFDKLPQVQAILVDESIDPEQRVFKLFDLIVQAEAAQAATL